MGGYRNQIQKACYEAGRHGGVFTVRDVLNLLNGPYAPTKREVEQELRLLDILEVARLGDTNRPTEYRLRRER